MSVRKENYELSSENYREIGRIVVWFEALQIKVCNLISILIRPEIIRGGRMSPASQQRVGQAVGEAMTEKQRADAISFLADLRWGADDPLTYGLKKLADEISVVNDRRNTLLHSYWVQGDNPEAMRSKWKLRQKGFKSDTQQHTTKELAADAEKIRDVIHKVEDLKADAFHAMIGLTTTQSGEPLASPTLMAFIAAAKKRR